MKSGFILRDDPPAKDGGLRPTTWHISALLASGFHVQVHEAKLDATGQCWRTWQVTEMPVVPSADIDISRGAAHCVAKANNREIHSVRPFSPYLSAYLGARHLDILAFWRESGGVGWVSRSIGPGVSPVAELVEAGTAPDLAEMALGSPVRARITQPILAAAMVTLGFPLAGLTAEGVPIVLGVSQSTSTAPSDAESLLCPGLSFSKANHAVEALERAVKAQEQRNSVSDQAALSDDGPLAPGHLFNWAWMGALRRDRIRPLEDQMGYDSSKFRSHILQPKRGRVDDGLAVICTADEYQLNEAAILSHLRRR